MSWFNLFTKIRYFDDQGCEITNLTPEDLKSRTGVYAIVQENLKNRYDNDECLRLFEKSRGKNFTVFDEVTFKYLNKNEIQELENLAGNKSAYIPLVDSDDLTPKAPKVKSKKIRIPLPKKLREVILAMYDHKCIQCATSKSLQIHHLDGDPTNNETYNLSVLCHECHKYKRGED